MSPFSVEVERRRTRTSGAETVRTTIAYEREKGKVGHVTVSGTGEVRVGGTRLRPGSESRGVRVTRRGLFVIVSFPRAHPGLLVASHVTRSGGHVLRLAGSYAGSVSGGLCGELKFGATPSSGPDDVDKLLDDNRVVDDASPNDDVT